ncbi:MAG: amidinotransferase [Azospira oryzae]|jgi:hypothetical protein|nr:MAG: amidinotransferase [Azospira oryzae]
MSLMNTPHALLMVRPASFAFNEETAGSNSFQQKGDLERLALQQQALAEFDAVVEKLKEKNIHLIIAEDTATPQKPDAIFPNNWISTHSSGTIVTYPMMAVSRRSERREDIVKLLKAVYAVNRVLDITGAEWDNKYLEGTGSIVYDHANKRAYACRSPRTSEFVLNELCRQIGYEAIVFDAVDAEGTPVYHTNVLMWIGEKVAALCLDSIKSEADQDKVIDSLTRSDHKIIAISFDQMKAFAGNMFEVMNKDEEVFLLMSTTAFQSLLPGQLNEMSKHAEPLIVSIDIIEKYGGGGIRCMVAGIYLPARN